MYACQNGNIETVKLLLARDASRVTKDNQGRTALDFARWSGEEAVVALFH
jgi:ankyrin repeat protein